mmetsp:Transcript_147612/g.209653  ORF Transcript_147612/g.209653 Transcript_147612/m.209653 type:complete len:93 (+) Transcript_147612:218-496(+)
MMCSVHRDTSQRIFRELPLAALGVEPAREWGSHVLSSLGTQACTARRGWEPIGTSSHKGLAMHLSTQAKGHREVPPQSRPEGGKRHEMPFSR